MKTHFIRETGLEHFQGGEVEIKEEMVEDGTTVGIVTMEIEVEGIGETTSEAMMDLVEVGIMVLVETEAMVEADILVQMVGEVMVDMEVIQEQVEAHMVEEVEKGID